MTKKHGHYGYREYKSDMRKRAAVRRERERIMERVRTEREIEKRRRESKTELDLSNKNLKSLDLSDYINLEKLNCSDNQLTSLDLNRLIKLKELNCSNNKFGGSLDYYVSNLKNLERLNISDNDINEVSIDKLPKGLKEIKYSINARPGCKLIAIVSRLEKYEWKDVDSDFTLELRREWEGQGCNKEQTKEWIEKGFNLNDFSWVGGWKKTSTAEQTKLWVSAGVKIDDYEFVVWLRDIKKLSPKWITNYKEDYQILSGRFKKYGLCSECNQPNTGEQWCQSCNAKHFQQDFSNWTSGNKEIDKFIQKHQLEATEANKLLEWIPYEQFNNIEKVKELQAVNSELQSLHSQHEKLNKSKFKQVINSSKIKKIEQKITEQSTRTEKLTGEIEEEKVEYLAEGGFGKVYKAKWNSGYIGSWDNKNNKWVRYRKNSNQENNYVLKSLSNAQNITQEFLQEVKNHKIIDDWFNNVVPCYGISQDPQGNYLMVMKYIEGGNLRKFLQKDYHRLNLESKLLRLINIAQGLKDIHQKDLIHRDFHSGNILSDNQKCFVTDLGLSRTVSSELEKEGKILGVLPYVAPEVLCKGKYSQKSDIYSFGIIATEILTGIPPFCNVEHDTSLAVQICQGLRPNLGKIKIPQLLEDLIKRCWDAEPNNRPTANELVKTSREWQIEIGNRNGEFYRQLVESEECNKKLSDEIRFPKHEIHSYNSYTSKPINTKQITERLKTMEYSKSLAIDFGEFNLENNQNWTNIHSDFSEELINQWKIQNFTPSQTQNWLNIGLQPTDYNLCAYLRDTKNLTSEQVLNHYNLQELNQEFFTWWQQNQLQTHIQQSPK